MQVDLHGYSVPLAIAATRHVLHDLQSRTASATATSVSSVSATMSQFTSPSASPTSTAAASATPPAATAPNLLIITGQGKGSSGHVPLVQRALLRELRHAVVLPDNRGRISVDLNREFLLLEAKALRAAWGASQSD